MMSGLKFDKNGSIKGCNIYKRGILTFCEIWHLGNKADITHCWIDIIFVNNFLYYNAELSIAEGTRIASNNSDLV